MTPQSPLRKKKQSALWQNFIISSQPQGFKVLCVLKPMFPDAWRYLTVRPSVRPRRLCPVPLVLHPLPPLPSLRLILLSPLGPMRPPNRWLENLKRHRGDGNQTLWCVNQTERDSLMRVCAHETEPRTERRATPKTTPTNKP